MNIKKAIYMLGIAAMIGLGSCNDDFTQPPVTLPEGGIGSGAWDNPMSAYQASLGSVNYEIPQPWVTGFIVGYVNVDISTVCNENSCIFESPAVIGTNILIAATPEERDFTKCVPVQLPGNWIRDMLSLEKNPDIIGSQICVQGTTGSKYCGQYGVRDLVNACFGEIGIEPDATVEPAPVGAFFQTFSDSNLLSWYEERGWRNVIVEGGLAGWNPVNFNGNTYMATSAFRGYAQGGPYEQWLITPAIDVNQLAEKTLEFATSAMTPAEGTTLEAYVMTDNNPAEGKYTLLNATMAEAPASGYSEWVSSGKIDISGYGDLIYIGWRYRAEKGGFNNSVTYCLTDVNVGNLEKPVYVDWSNATQISKMLDPADTTCDWKFDNIFLASGLSSVWSWRSQNGSEYYLNASAYLGGTNKESESYAISPAVMLDGYTYYGVEFSHAAKFQTTITTLARLAVREVGTTEWTEFEIPGWPAAGGWSFADSGVINISEFAGKNVEIALKYASTDQGADTWEIRNLIVYGK